MISNIHATIRKRDLNSSFIVFLANALCQAVLYQSLPAGRSKLQLPAQIWMDKAKLLHTIQRLFADCLPANPLGKHQYHRGWSDLVLAHLLIRYLAAFLKSRRPAGRGAFGTRLFSYFLLGASSCRTRFATSLLVSRNEFNSSRDSVRAVPVGVPALTFTTYVPLCTLTLSICVFDASADFFACSSVDEVTCFGGRKALKSETETFFPPLFELTMFVP